MSQQGFQESQELRPESLFLGSSLQPARPNAHTPDSQPEICLADTSERSCLSSGAPHLVGSTEDIEELRTMSPPLVTASGVIAVQR